MDGLGAAFSVCVSLAGWYVCVYVDLLSDTSGWDEGSDHYTDRLPDWLAG